MRKRDILRLADDPEKNPLGLSGTAIYARIHYRGWTLEEALSTPPMTNHDGGRNARRNPTWNNFNLS